MLLTIISSGQTLTFRLANPNLINDSGTDYFAFDIQVRADAAGSYLWSGQAVVSFGASLSSVADNWIVNFGPILSGTYSGSTPKYSTLQTITGSNFNLGFYGNPGNVNQTAFTRFNQITTSYQTVATVWAPITNPGGVAGVDFVEGSMDGFQSKKLLADPWFTGYTNPSGYDAANFLDTYLGRIYANAAWSQFGGTIDWTASVNTAVWDGTATIPGGSVSSASALKVYAPATLTIPVNGKLTVSGTTDIGAAAGLAILSDATGTGSLITGTTTGTALVQRYMVGGSPTAWHLISSPVGAQSIQTFVNSGANNIAFNGPKFGLAPWDNSLTPANWNHYNSGTLPGAGDFVGGKGYEVLRTIDGTVSFTGTVASTAVGIGVTQAASKDWNLIGNPFTSGVNANTSADVTNNFLTVNNAVLATGYKAVYIYNQSTGTYDIVNNSTGATYIPVGQAFFVRANTGGGTANFTAAQRTHSASAFKATESEWPSINVKAAISGTNKNTMIYFIPGTTTGIDEGYDAGVFDGDNASTLLATRIADSDINFGIQTLPDVDMDKNVIPVVLNAAQGSNVVFTVETSNLSAGTKVYLEDKLTGKFTRLDEIGSFYTVNLTAVSNGSGRFFIHTTQGTMGVDAELLSDLTVISLPREHKIRVLGTVTPNSLATIYELNGAVVGTQVLPNVGENEMPFTPVSSGVYLLKVQQTGKTPTSVKINWIY